MRVIKVNVQVGRWSLIELGECSQSAACLTPGAEPLQKETERRSHFSAEILSDHFATDKKRPELAGFQRATVR